MIKLIYLLTLVFTLQVFSTETQDNLKKHIEYLASEELEGRQPGTDGIEKAAVYIENYFDELGLKKINDSYRQEFEIVTGKELSGTNSLDFDVIIPKPGIPRERLKPRKRNWTVESDWLPMSSTANGSASGQVAFVGYGISSEELGYDDYAGIDVNGKIVIILSDSPDGESRSGSFAKYANFNYKASTAKKNGAAGILFVKIQGDSADVFDPLNVSRRMNMNAGIVAAQVSRSKIAKLFPRKSQLFEVEKEINASLKPNSFLFENVNANLSVEVSDTKRKTHNILAFLKGDSKDMIVIGAHYDHLGYGMGGSSRYRGKEKKIHYGADDNASGTAAMMELARILKDSEIESSVLFCAWSAEEMGLIGSKFFSDNLPVDVTKIKAYYNFDMIGRLENNEVSVLGTATSPIWDEILESRATEMGLTLQKIKSGTGPSDHSSFYKLDKPVLAFFSGIHSDYHTPSDTPDKINLEGSEKIVNYALAVIKSAEEKDEITFSKVAEPDSKKKMGRTRSNVTFGVIPNYSSNEHGFVIDDIIIGGPAHEGGMLGGDIIIEIDGNKISNIYDFMYAYWDKQPGDVVNVKVLRGGRKDPIAMKVKLAAKE